MFKRRDPRSWGAAAARLFWPRGGWARAARYIGYRLRRLPDPAHKISRGIAVGVFVSFTPFFGLHFIVSAILAWIVRANILAALLATFVGNPLTFPVIAGISVELGSRILGIDHAMPLHQTFAAFSRVSVELWLNVKALFTSAEMEWSRVIWFFDTVFLPYLIGGLGPGLICAVAAHYLSRPLIVAYQKSRIAKLRRRFDKERAAAMGDVGGKV